MAQYAVLVFRRDTPLTTDQQVAFTKNFGELEAPYRQIQANAGLRLSDPALVEPLACVLRGFDAVHVPFKLFSDALGELFSARVHFYVSPITAVLPHARDGKLRGLAVTSAARVPTAPEVPTMNESGLPAAQLDTWFGIAGPAGMPRGLVTQLNRDIAAVLQDADTRERVLRQGATPAASTPEQLSDTLKKDFVRFRKIIADAGLKPQ